MLGRGERRITTINVVVRRICLALLRKWEDSSGDMQMERIRDNVL